MNINNVTLTGNLTRDLDPRELESGTKVANLRIAVNGRRRTAAGEYVDTVDYFDVAVFGARAESCADYLSKGRPIAVQGRLAWRETKKDDRRREYVKVIAEQVEFLGRRPAEPKDEAEAAEEPAQESLPEAEPVAA
jgi:single-strand DNA-binding protein